MRFLSPTVHAALDYVLVVAFAAAPLLVPMSEIPASFCWVVAAGHLLVSLLTAFPGGVTHALSFPTHGILELLAGLALAAAPWALGFSSEGPSRTWFLAWGIGMVATWACTDYRAALVPPQDFRERRV